MYKIHLKKRAKKIITVICILIVVLFIAHLFCNNLDKYERAGKFCDSVKGTTCTHYEVETIMKRGY